jgi:integrase
MRVRFYTEKRRGENGMLLTKRRPIFMTVAFNGKRVLISTGKHVDLKWWDQKQQQVRTTHPEAPLINRWLQTLAYTAGTVWRSLASLSENPGAEEFRKEFERLRPRYSGGFFEILYLFMEEGSSRWSSSSYRKVRTFYNQLRTFEKEEDYPLQFNTINRPFLDRFNRHLEQKGMSPTTIRKMVNTLVWYLNWATNQGFNIYTDYRGFYQMLDAKDPEAQPESPVFLEWHELMQFADYRINNPWMERSRDFFCLMCLTGLRFGELKGLKKEDVDPKLLRIRSSSSKRREVPLNNYAATILKRYEQRFYRNNTALPQVSVTTLNKYIRIIAKELNMKRGIATQPDRTLRPLWEVLTAGSAVQTFIMHALRLEIPPEVITAFTGIKNDRRIKLLQQEMASKQIKKFNDLTYFQ